MMLRVATLLRPHPVFRGWWIVGTGLLALVFSGGATTYVFSVLIKPIEDELGWSRAIIVGVITLGGLVSGFLSAPMGPLFDKYGARALMTVSAIFGGLCFMLTGAVTQVWQFYLLLGIGEAITRPALENLGPRTAIANWFIRKRAAAFAVFSTGRSISGILLVPIAALLIATVSWRWVFVLVGIVELLVLAPLSWIAVRRRPEELGLLPDGESPRRASEGGDEAEASAPAQEPVWTRGQVLRTKTYWLLTLGFLLNSFPASSIYIHMASFLQDKGFNPLAAASGISVYGWGAFSGRVVWGAMAAKLGIRNTLTIYASSYSVVILLYTLASEELTIYPAIFALGIVIGGAQQLSAQVWPDYYGRNVVGAVSGITTLINTPASASSPLILALVYDVTHSYVGVHLFCAALTLVAAGFFLFAARPTPPALAPALGQAAGSR